MAKSLKQELKYEKSKAVIYKITLVKNHTDRNNSRDPKDINFNETNWKELSFDEGSAPNAGQSKKNSN